MAIDDGCAAAAQEVSRARRKRFRLFSLLAPLFLAAACTSIKPPDHHPLTKEIGTNQWVAHSGKEYRLGQMPPREGKGQKSEDILLVAALSGGGKRSAAFAYGVFDVFGPRPDLESATGDLAGDARVWMLNEDRERVYTTILREVDLISGVSGGALTASYYALHRGDLFRARSDKCSFQSFLYEDTGAEIIGLYTLPWRWGWMFSGAYGSNDVMADFFAKRLFSNHGECTAPIDGVRTHGATYADLYDSYAEGAPFLMLQSTDVTRGIAFPYTQDSFDLLCSDISLFPLAWALAGSNGFPVVLSAIGRRNHNFERQSNGKPDLCRPKNNAWLSNKVFGGDPGCMPMENFMDQATKPEDEEEKFENRGVRLRLLEGIARCHVWPNEAEFAHLSDGGMTDNFALRGLSDWFETHYEDDPAYRHVVHVTKRILVMVIDGQRETDTEIATKAAGPSVLSSIPAMISNNVDQGNVASLSEMADTLERMSKWLEIRDLMIAHRSWAAHKAETDDKLEAKTFDAWVSHKDFAVAFNKTFEAHVRTFLNEEKKWKQIEMQVAETENVMAASMLRQQAKQAEAALKQLDEPVRKKHLLRLLGDSFGSLRYPGIDWGVVARRVGPKNSTEFLAALTELKLDLQTLAFWRAQKGLALTDMVKISITDDCNTTRKAFLAQSDTGLGLDEKTIDAAIAAGREVALQHLPRVSPFVEHGRLAAVPLCDTWSGAKTAVEGASKP